MRCYSISVIQKLIGGSLRLSCCDYGTHKSGRVKKSGGEFAAGGRGNLNSTNPRSIS